MASCVTVPIVAVRSDETAGYRLAPSRGCRQCLFRFLVTVDIDNDGDGTAVADEDDGLSAGDEGDEGIGGLTGDGEKEWFMHSPIVLV
jgi:hypothetical protein